MKAGVLLFLSLFLSLDGSLLFRSRHNSLTLVPPCLQGTPLCDAAPNSTSLPCILFVTQLTDYCPTFLPPPSLSSHHRGSRTTDFCCSSGAGTREQRPGSPCQYGSHLGRDGGPNVTSCHGSDILHLSHGESSGHFRLFASVPMRIVVLGIVV